MDLSISTLAPERATPVPEVLVVETPEGQARLREPTGADDEREAHEEGGTGPDRRRKEPRSSGPASSSIWAAAAR